MFNTLYLKKAKKATLHIFFLLYLLFSGTGSLVAAEMTEQKKDNVNTNVQHLDVDHAELVKYKSIGTFLRYLIEGTGGKAYEQVGGRGQLPPIKPIEAKSAIQDEYLLEYAALVINEYRKEYKNVGKRYEMSKALYNNVRNILSFYVELSSGPISGMFGKKSDSETLLKEIEKDNFDYKKLSLRKKNVNGKNFNKDSFRMVLRYGIQEIKTAEKLNYTNKKYGEEARRALAIIQFGDKRINNKVLFNDVVYQFKSTGAEGVYEDQALALYVAVLHNIGKRDQREYASFKEEREKMTKLYNELEIVDGYNLVIGNKTYKKGIRSIKSGFDTGAKTNIKKQMHEDLKGMPDLVLQDIKNIASKIRAVDPGQQVNLGKYYGKYTRPAKNVDYSYKMFAKSDNLAYFVRLYGHARSQKLEAASKENNLTEEDKIFLKIWKKNKDKIGYLTEPVEGDGQMIASLNAVATLLFKDNFLFYRPVEQLKNDINKLVSENKGGVHVINDEIKKAYLDLAKAYANGEDKSAIEKNVNKYASIMKYTAKDKQDGGGSVDNNDLKNVRQDLRFQYMGVANYKTRDEIYKFLVTNAMSLDTLHQDKVVEKILLRYTIAQENKKYQNPVWLDYGQGNPVKFQSYDKMIKDSQFINLNAKQAILREVMTPKDQKELEILLAHVAKKKADKENKDKKYFKEWMQYILYRLNMPVGKIEGKKDYQTKLKGCLKEGGNKVLFQNINAGGVQENEKRYLMYSVGRLQNANPILVDEDTSNDRNIFVQIGKKIENKTIPNGNDKALDAYAIKFAGANFDNLDAQPKNPLKAIRDAVTDGSIEKVISDEWKLVPGSIDKINIEKIKKPFQAIRSYIYSYASKKYQSDEQRLNAYKLELRSKWNKIGINIHLSNDIALEYAKLSYSINKKGNKNQVWKYWEQFLEGTTIVGKDTAIKKNQEDNLQIAVLLDVFRDKNNESKYKALQLIGKLLNNKKKLDIIKDDNNWNWVFDIQEGGNKTIADQAKLALQSLVKQNIKTGVNIKKDNINMHSEYGTIVNDNNDELKLKYEKLLLEYNQLKKEFIQSKNNKEEVLNKEEYDNNDVKIQDESSKLRIQLNKAKNELSVIKNQLNIKKNELNNKRNELNNKTNAYNKLKINFEQLKNNVNNNASEADTKLNNLQNNYKELQKNYAKLQEKIRVKDDGFNKDDIKDETLKAVGTDIKNVLNNNNYSNPGIDTEDNDIKNAYQAIKNKLDTQRNNILKQVAIDIKAKLNDKTYKIHLDTNDKDIEKVCEGIKVGLSNSRNNLLKTVANDIQQVLESQNYDEAGVDTPEEDIKKAYQAIGAKIQTYVNADNTENTEEDTILDTEEKKPSTLQKVGKVVYHGGYVFSVLALCYLVFEPVNTGVKIAVSFVKEKGGALLGKGQKDDEDSEYEEEGDDEDNE